MNRSIAITRSAAGTARPIISLLVLSILLAGSGLTGVADAAVGTPTASEKFGDDNHFSTINPYPAIAISTIASNPPGQCEWINTGLTNFIAANPANGTGPSGAAWSYSWAGVALEAKVEAGLSFVSPYQAYVVTKPQVTAGDGTVYPSVGPFEMGGAVFNIKYTPQAGAPAINNLHWIQAYTGTFRGANVPQILDNDPAHPYTAQSSVSPFYDTDYAAGTLAGGGGWFLDRPQVPENEYETNPVADVQFQAVLASDTTTVVGGVTNHALTLYGGLWWGFSYTALEVPEPATFVLLAFGGIGLLVIRRRYRQKFAIE